MVVTNHDDEIKKIAGRTPEATQSVKNSNKTVIATEAIIFCIKLLTHYFSRSALKIQVCSKNLNHCHQENQNATKFYIIENVW